MYLVEPNFIIYLALVI